jgi:hypothetical protein
MTNLERLSLLIEQKGERCDEAIMSIDTPRIRMRPTITIKTNRGIPHKQ